jgi:LDH2 family malate/lactate/ureidoglycolate dehydrogenase
MENDVVWVDFDFMEQFMIDVFIELGVSREDAEICADVLITSDKRGIDSHGVNRLKPMYYDRIKAGIQFPDAKYEIVRETSTTAVIDGHRGMGHATAKHAMELAIQKAKKHGLGMTVVRNNTHYGIAGYYVLMATEEGMIGLSGTNARPSVAPTYGVEPMLGTNPLTVGMPTDEDFPFVIDPATSIIQRGKVEVYARSGEKLPEGLVIDQNGDFVTDPNLILEELLSKEASLLPLGGKAETGGYKGYGYSTVVEILSSALQGGAFLQAVTGVNVGHFFMAIDVEAFTDLGSFKKTTGDILRTLRSAKRMPNEPRIYTAGEKEHLAWLERKSKGVPLNKSLQAEVLQMRDELGLKTRFPFE